MSKTFNSALSKPANLENPQSFQDFSAGIGYYSLRKKYPEALSLIDRGLAKFKHKSERYEILCMAGDCQKNQKIWKEARSLFEIAGKSAYEPVAARAKLGLVECEVAGGSVGEGENTVYKLIDEVKESEERGLTANESGGYTMSPIPMSAGAVAMAACAIFDRYGYRDKGSQFLEYSIGGDYKKNARTSGALAKRKEQSQPEEARIIYQQLLSLEKLGTREVDFLAGLLRIDPATPSSEISSYMERFRPIAKPRAMFITSCAFRGAGREEWREYATKVSNPLNFSKKAKKHSDHILAAEALKLLSKEAGVNKDWTAVAQFSNRLLGMEELTSQEAVAAVRSIATSEVRRTGTLDKSKIYDLCDKAKNQKLAKYGVARAMMQIEDYPLAEQFFNEVLADASINETMKSKARFNLAECYDKSGKPALALQMYEDVLKNPDLDQKFAIITAAKMISPMSKLGGDQTKILPQINELIDKTSNYVSLLDMSRIIKQNGTLPTECYMRAYQKGRALAGRELDNAKTPESAMKTLFLLGRRQRDLLLYKEFVDDYAKFAEGRLGWLSRAPAPYWEYGAFAFEIMNAINMPVQADVTWAKILGEGEKKPSGVELSHYHLFKGIVNLSKGRSEAKAEFAKVIELAPLHVNASRAYYWLALVDRGNGKVAEATNYAMRGLNATGIQGGYVWQQNLRKKLDVLAHDFNIEKAAPGKNHISSYKKAAGEVMLDLKKVEKLVG